MLSLKSLEEDSSSLNYLILSPDPEATHGWLRGLGIISPPLKASGIFALESFCNQEIAKSGISTHSSKPFLTILAVAVPIMPTTQSVP